MEENFTDLNVAGEIILIYIILFGVSTWKKMLET